MGCTVYLGFFISQDIGDSPPSVVQVFYQRVAKKVETKTLVTVLRDSPGAVGVVSDHGLYYGSHISRISGFNELLRLACHVRR